MKYLSLVSFFLFTCNLCAQTSYNGFIGKYPIELVMNMYPDGVVDGFYVYTKHDEPVRLRGKLENNLLSLNETDSSGKDRAIFIFKNFDTGKDSLKGTWKDFNTGKELPVSLAKSKNTALLQPASLKNYYFKVLISKDEDNFLDKVSTVKIFEKRSDKLFQQIEVECQYGGLNCISVDDYNFDGIPDFSLFEHSYAGPNTSSIYFLFDPGTGKFFKSSFEGTSLEFDQSTKKIYEHNQCCAGRSQMMAEYKVANNRMILLKKECREYDDTTEDFKVVKCE